MSQLNMGIDSLPSLYAEKLCTQKCKNGHCSKPTRKHRNVKKVIKEN